jgi:hypothetical protein
MPSPRRGILGRPEQQEALGAFQARLDQFARTSWYIRDLLGPAERGERSEPEPPQTANRRERLWLGSLERLEVVFITRGSVLPKTGIFASQ